MTSPFQDPAAKGQAPYCLREWESASADEHLRLIRWMELMKKEEAEACRMAKPDRGPECS